MPCLRPCQPISTLRCTLPCKAFYNSFFNIIDQSCMVAANAMVGPRSWLGGLFNRFGNRRGEKFLDYTLTPIQVIENVEY